MGSIVIPFSGFVSISANHFMNKNLIQSTMTVCPCEGKVIVTDKSS